MIGRFHELSIDTQDIRASVEFYESLGFSQTATNDTWQHPYGVLTDGEIFIGLHQRRSAGGSALTFVQPDVKSHLRALEALGITMLERQTGDDEFHRVTFADPGGQIITLIEARTYSPPGEDAGRMTLCGQFQALSLPERDFETGQQFWAQLGFEEAAEAERPYPSVRLRRQEMHLELHRNRTLDAPILIFAATDMGLRVEALRVKGVPILGQLPRGLDPEANAMLEAPEGTALLLLADESA